MFDKKILCNITEPWIIPIEIDKDNFEQQLNEFKSDTTNQNLIFLLNGNKMKNVNSLFNEFAIVLQFPSYFGKNWNAFDECINDLDWFYGENYIIVINEAQNILINDKIEEIEIFFKICKNSCIEWSKPLDLDEEWGRSGKPFHFLLQFENKHKTIFKERISHWL